MRKGRREGWGRGKRTGDTEKEQRAKERADGSKKGQRAKKRAVGSKMGGGLEKGQRDKKRGEGLKKGELIPNPLPRQVVSLRIRLAVTKSYLTVYFERQESCEAPCWNFDDLSNSVGKFSHS